MGDAVEPPGHRQDRREIRIVGNDRITVITETKKEAVEVARKIAKNNHSELVIHGKDGKIQDKDSYSNDTIPPKDKKH